jgi:hypothetical protein
MPRSPSARSQTACDVCHAHHRRGHRRLVTYAALTIGAVIAGLCAVCGACCSPTRGCMVETQCMQSRLTRKPAVSTVAATTMATMQTVGKYSLPEHAVPFGHDESGCGGGDERYEECDNGGVGSAASIGGLVVPMCGNGLSAEETSTAAHSNV